MLWIPPGRHEVVAGYDGVGRALGRLPYGTHSPTFVLVEWPDGKKVHATATGRVLPRPAQPAHRLRQPRVRRPPVRLARRSAAARPGTAGLAAHAALAPGRDGSDVMTRVTM